MSDTLRRRAAPHSASAKHEPQQAFSPIRKGPVLATPLDWLYAAVKLTRPHTIVHTTLAPMAVTAMALGGYGQLVHIPGDIWANLLLVQFGFMMANVWIVGINQIYDIDIDQINKAELPLPAGILSIKQAWVIITTALMVGTSCIMLGTSNNLIRGLWAFGTFLGTLYSIPSVRGKNSAMYTCMAITFCRGVIFPTCIYANVIDHFRPGASYLAPDISYVILFSIFWVLAISIFKDLPDVKGDLAHGSSNTLPLTIGIPNTVRLCMAIMFSPLVFSMVLTPTTYMLIWHTTLAAVLAIGWAQMDYTSKASLTAFYRVVVWNSLYLEYLLLPVTASVARLAF
ncbi:hypothetical protein CXG81DRAFT_18519 [Caulochytrium protostelioides]|uniref:UbiA prenyltransferase n=1 Tax=Caulochytrium protostelioides TaxID=1555241 RepID=A0A4P9X8U8_9FUNG|nr:hypothetical protein CAUPRSCDRAFT_10729 [Caulochytrium protostelioides]RKP01698.1 hypothetical protein CXG81DRAFT_18519 [Caulochytrium protostelioides]|eukprot:RKP01698.1 hypothetical protein CXG81DRAFT_18519 [Caulochytrium protostelioides]